MPRFDNRDRQAVEDKPSGARAGALVVKGSVQGLS